MHLDLSLEGHGCFELQDRTVDYNNIISFILLTESLTISSRMFGNSDGFRRGTVLLNAGVSKNNNVSEFLKVQIGFYSKSCNASF